MGAPPGEVEAVRASRTLILAPHHGDEILGCGGLAAQLAERGQVAVVWIGDGAGAPDEEPDPAARGERTRREARQAIDVLGLEAAAELGLPEAALGDYVPEIGHILRQAIAEGRPDLLLVPSPLEADPGRRAGFDAAWSVLSAATRDDHELWPAVRGLRVLLYEVDRPAAADVLVDVSARVDLFAAALEEHRGMLERHDVRRAVLGLRAYRTLTLAPSVGAAEAYRSLEFTDFQTRSRADLIRHVGGVTELTPVEAGPLVSLVVRTRDRPGRLAEALESVVRSTYRRLEIVLVNDGGDTPSVRSAYPFPVRPVELLNNQGPAGAAQAGLDAAAGEYVLFLDDDDLISPEHVARLVKAARSTGLGLVYADAAIGVYETGADGAWECTDRRVPYARDFDGDLLLLNNYIPFHTALIERCLLGEAGGFDTELPFFEDWDMLIRLSALTRFQRVPGISCEYRHFVGSDQAFGSASAKRPDFAAVRARVMAKHAARLDAATLSAALTRLLEESVQERESTARVEREIARLQRGGGG